MSGTGKIIIESGFLLCDHFTSQHVINGTRYIVDLVLCPLYQFVFSSFSWCFGTVALLAMESPCMFLSYFLTSLVHNTLICWWNEAVLTLRIFTPRKSNHEAQFCYFLWRMQQFPVYNFSFVSEGMYVTFSPRDEWVVIIKGWNVFLLNLQKFTLFAFENLWISLYSKPTWKFGYCTIRLNLDFRLGVKIYVNVWHCVNSEVKIYAEDYYGNHSLLFHQ